MEFREVVRRRRMVRSYRDRPVDRAVVERVVALARRAPSAGFAQGQRFVVVTDRRTREAVADLAGEDRYVARGFDPWLSRAPVHVAVCADERAYRARYQQADKRDTGGPHWEVPYWLVDAGASLMLLLLAAVDEGLAAGLLGSHRMPGLAALLGIPPGVHPVGVVTLGHPAPDRRSGSLARGWQDLGEAVHWERWGGG
ncbi:MAG TPA: nitroreductase family protein [Nitriliruptorales bacterium]|nr:nitroreductase family protein [Nitriliruptorales bacterium]